MGLLTGPISWLSAGSEGGGGPAPTPLPEAALDPLWGTRSPEDADTVLDDFGCEVTIEGLGCVKILYDDLMFTDEHGPVTSARGYKLARFKRGALGGARLSQTTCIISNGVTQSSFRVIGPVERESSLFDRYVLEPKRKET